MTRDLRASSGSTDFATFKALVGYVKPYSFRMIVGVLLVAFVAAAEGIVALMIKPAVEYVLDPSKFSPRLALLTASVERADHLPQ